MGTARELVVGSGCWLFHARFPSVFTALALEVRSPGDVFCSRSVRARAHVCTYPAWSCSVSKFLLSSSAIVTFRLVVARRYEEILLGGV